MNPVKYPSLYEVNTRVWLTDLSLQLGRKATLDDIPDDALDDFVQKGFNWIWLLSVWTTGEKAQKISRQNPAWREEFASTLPDLKEEDIKGSGFAIAAYQVHPDLGGDDALRRLRERMRSRGLQLMLDFVPNHMGPDHPWIHDHPDYFIHGTEDDLENEPGNFTKIISKGQEIILAHGRDPFFPGWPDTIQLDYSNPATVSAMSRELLRIASQCDGVRCDMAMVILPDVFERTWGRRAESFWPVIIPKVRENHPAFCFLAEVYWDMEWTLQQQGFDYTYDKRLYDRLLEDHTRSIREHFYAGLFFQDKLARFLENHDERRAAAVFDHAQHEAAAILTFLSPGMRFFHQGQLEGKKIKVSPHLIRAPQEPIDVVLQKFYTSLLELLKKPLFRAGTWHLLECAPAWDWNDSWNSFLAFEWEHQDAQRALVIVNYAPTGGQCYVKLPFIRLTEQRWRLHDVLNEVSYDREGDELMTRGLYLDVAPWKYHVFEMISMNNE